MDEDQFTEKMSRRKMLRTMGTVGVTVAAGSVVAGSVAAMENTEQVSQAGWKGLEAELAAPDGSAKIGGVCRVVNSVAEMKLLGGISSGQRIRTLGYYSAGDGGGNDYLVVAQGTGVEDGGSLIDIPGFQAKGLFSNGEYWADQFGARTDGANAVPYIQKLVAYLETDSRGGEILLGRGVYTWGSTLTITKNGVSIRGRSPLSTEIKIAGSFTGTCCIYIGRPSGATGKCSIEDIRFNSVDNDTGINGIEFRYLIYNNNFRNLDFESFTGSWFYTERSEFISEHITWDTVQGNARTKIPTKSPFDLYHINESIIINAKVFGKQYKSFPYPAVPMLYCDRPQGFTVFASSFATTAAEAIKYECTAGAMQGIFIHDCTFEEIDGPSVINISGLSNTTRSEYGMIGRNRYLECVNPKIIINHFVGLEIRDFKPSVELGAGTIQCVVETLLSDGSTITNTSKVVDGGTDNIVILNEKSAQIFGTAGANGRYVLSNGKYSFHQYGIATGKFIRQQADYQSSNLQRMRFLLDGTTDLGGFTNHGLYGKVQTIAGSPPTTGVSMGSIVPNDGDKNLYVHFSDGWYAIQLIKV